METKIISSVEEFEAALKAGHRITAEEIPPVVTISRAEASDAQRLHAALQQAGGWERLRIVEGT